MQNVYILMGLPGAGKTTWAATAAEKDDNLVIVSRDGIRYSLKNGYAYNNSQKHQNLVHEVSSYILRNALLKGFNVVLDQLSLTKGGRYDACEDIASLALDNNLDIKTHLVHLTEKENNVQRRLDSDMRWGDKEYYEKLIADLKEQMEAVERWEHFDSYTQIDKNGGLEIIW